MPTENQQDCAILVLNRDHNDVELITLLLEKVGLRVSSASNADEALELFGMAGNSAVLLIIDEDASPATPGFLECVHSLNPGIRTLMISDREQPEPVQHWSAQGNVRAVLKRPFRRAKFLGSVLEVIGEPLVRTA